MNATKTYFNLDFLKNVQKYQDAVVGIKLSGKCLDDFEIRRNIVRQVLELRALGTKVVLVHGGGKQITEECAKAGIQKDERQGLRYTTQPELDIMKRCVPSLTKQLVEDFDVVSKKLGLGISTIGLNGYDGKLVSAELHSDTFEGSRTGKVVGVDTKSVRSLMDNNIVVMNSICAGTDGEWNVNADDVFEAVAKATGAKLAIMCSDTALYDSAGQTITRLFTDAVGDYYADGTFNDKIKPKVDAAVKMADDVCPVAIVNGADPSAIERELYTSEGGGTLILSRSAPAPTL